MSNRSVMRMTNCFKSFLWDSFVSFDRPNWTLNTSSGVNEIIQSIRSQMLKTSIQPHFHWSRLLLISTRTNWRLDIWMASEANRDNFQDLPLPRLVHSCLVLTDHKLGPILTRKHLHLSSRCAVQFSNDSIVVNTLITRQMFLHRPKMMILLQSPAHVSTIVSFTIGTNHRSTHWPIMNSTIKPCSMFCCQLANAFIVSFQSASVIGTENFAPIVPRSMTMTDSLERKGTKACQLLPHLHLLNLHQLGITLKLT